MTEFVQHPSLLTLPDLRERTSVFADRFDAGLVLSTLLTPFAAKSPLLLAVPAGGVPVAAAVAERFGWELDVAVASKITLPWNTEAGYGAVAFDGTVRLNDELLPALGLSEGEIRRGIARTSAKVRRRVRLFREEEPFTRLEGRTAVVIDDGMASGLTLRTVVEAVRKLSPRALVVAVPTGHLPALESLAKEVSAVFCANVRGGRSFAVASAYRNWSDVSEEEALALLRRRKG